MTSYRSDQLAFSSLLSGAYASAAVALIFLIIDGSRGELLQTPSFVGSVMLLGESAANLGRVRLDVVGLYSLLHFLGFAAIGTAATFVAARWDILIRQPLLLAAGLMLGLSAGAVALDTVLFPGMITTIGVGVVTAANAMASAVMTWFVRSTLLATTAAEAATASTPA